MRRLPIFLALALLAPGCADDPTAPPRAAAGTLVVGIALPTAGEAALLLAVTGPDLPPPESFIAPDGLLAFGRRQGEGRVSMALFGEIRSGEVLRFPVPDVGRATAYSVSVVEAAGQDHALRTDLAAYRVTVTGHADGP